MPQSLEPETLYVSLTQTDPTQIPKSQTLNFRRADALRQPQRPKTLQTLSPEKLYQAISKRFEGDLQGEATNTWLFSLCLARFGGLRLSSWGFGEFLDLELRV